MPTPVQQEISILTPERSNGKPEIAIVLPAFNEESCIRDVLSGIRDALRTSGVEDDAVRILLVDDGSTDGTVDAAIAALPHGSVEVLRHPSNRGLGAALRTGLLAAAVDSDVVVTLDADNTHDPSLIPIMVGAVQRGHDVVVASRFAKGGRTVGVPFHRRMLSSVAGSLMALRFPFGEVRDYTSGFRAFRSGFLQVMIERLGEERFIEEDGFGGVLELILKARAAGARATELPLTLRYDQKVGPSKIDMSRTIRHNLRLLFRPDFRAH